MRIAKIDNGGLAEGPGPRTVVWFQGCPIRCPGCYNPHLWPFESGQEVHLDDVLAQVKASLASGSVGVSIVGGEPLAQPEACASLCVALHALGIHMIVYTGFAYEDVLSLVEAIPALQEILENADILVDGPFIQAEYDPGIAYRGSRNQRVIDLQLSRTYGDVVTIQHMWDPRQAITIRSGGSMVMPARLARMFTGRRVRARNCGQAVRGHT